MDASACAFAAAAFPAAAASPFASPPAARLATSQRRTASAADAAAAAARLGARPPSRAPRPAAVAVVRRRPPSSAASGPPPPPQESACACAGGGCGEHGQHGQEQRLQQQQKQQQEQQQEPLRQVQRLRQQRGSRAVAKQHAAAAMRGLSDTAWCAVLTELGRVCGPDAVVGGVAEAGIAFGALTGLWTAALVVRTVREHARRAADAAREIVDGWDRSFLYDRGIAEDDVLEVVAWMEALDELESTHGASLLWEMAGSSDPRKRRALAEVLGECGVQSNVVIGVVVALTDDDAEIVSRTANESLLKLVGAAVPPPAPFAAADARDDFLVALAEQEVEAVASARAQVDAVLFAAEESSVADAPEVAQCPASVVAPEESNTIEMLPRRLQEALRVQAPLFDWLAMSELRTLCAIATVPLCYEAFCLGGGADGWLRFVGLGWLMSVAGLVAYPQSNSIWKNLEQVLAEDA